MLAGSNSLLESATSRNQTLTTRKTTNMTKRQKEWKGMNWIRQDLRLAIYLRDSLACVWCGDSIENGAQFAVDHIMPHSLGGTNKPTNLVTSCVRCNCSRGNRSVEEFAVAVAAYLDHDVKPFEIVKHVAETSNRDISSFRARAKLMITHRGSAARVLAAKANPTKLTLD
jgi:5-methylcytosine-specific restriction endonuclease McrA